MNSGRAVHRAHQRGQAEPRWFDQQPVPNTGFGTLTKRLWRMHIRADDANDPETALKRQALLAPDENGAMRATVAGILLCTEHPEKHLPNARITAARHRGANCESDLLDAQEITGPVDRQIAAAMDFVIRNMSVAARKTPARVDLPQYSKRAVLEALVNAAVYRDYSIRDDGIRLSMYSNRLEIQSPGSLPGSLTVRNMDVQQAERNTALAAALGRMPARDIPGAGERTHLMERRGDGVRTIRNETRKLCGGPPIFDLIDGADLWVMIPSAPQKQRPVQAAITVRSGDVELEGVDVLALFPDHTWQRATTDAQGQACLDLHSDRLAMTVFAAAPGHAACIKRGWIPAERRSLVLDMNPLPGGGAVIFPEAAGILPGLKGRLNPIQDSFDRAYLCASNLTINQGRAQPVHFLPGEELRLTAANGNERWARFIATEGHSTLVEYCVQPRSVPQ